MKNVKAGHTHPIVCIDAGHYAKYNRSPVVPEYYESEMNWKLKSLLETQLKLYGIEVRHTRADLNKDMGLTARGKASKGADLFLSVHSNACDTESVDYPLAIVMQDGKGDALGEALAECVEALMGTKQDGRTMKKRGTNGGEWYSVLAGAASVGTMGIILEHSFHTNTAAAKWLLNEENLAKLAKAEAEVIAQYFDVAKGVQAEETPTESTYTLEQFIRDVQRACGAAVDGIAGSETIGKTVTLSAQKNRTHAAVKPVQKRLYTLGYTIVGEADGIAGPKFTAAVTAFQEDNKCWVDGEITARNKTWKKLLGME